MRENKIYFDTVWNSVYDTHGRDYPIKEHRGWKYINVDDKKVGVSRLEKKIRIDGWDDVVTNYIFCWCSTLPCPVVADWVHRSLIKSKLHRTNQ